MEQDLEQLHLRLEQDDSLTSASDCTMDTQDEETNFDTLLEEIQAIDDLDVLEDLEKKLLSELEFETEFLDKLHRTNAEVKDEINQQKSCIQELDKVLVEELQRIENLNEMITQKQQEVVQYQRQQVDDLDQFEFDVAEITKHFVSAPKKYNNYSLKTEINHLQNILEERMNEKEQMKKKVIEALKQFEEPAEFSSMDLALSFFDDAITEITASNQQLNQKLDKMIEEVNKLTLDIMTKRIGSK